MKREADNNRVKRAMEHVMAAITNLESIKWENRTVDEEKAIEGAIARLQSENLILHLLAKGGME
jgi:hypothetical protein